LTSIYNLSFKIDSFYLCNMIQIGSYNILKVMRKVEIGLYLDDGADGILLPKRFVPANVRVGDELKVLLYHDSDNRIIATTQEPKGVVGDIVLLECVSITPQGAFMDWGLMKDLFVARSQQLVGMRVGGKYLVKIYVDKQTDRVAATEKIEFQLSNEELTVKEMEEVDLVASRKSDIGYVMIINNLHTGVLHNNEMFRDIRIGDRMKGFIKTIRADNKIDLVLGKPGYQKVEDELDKVLRLLKENNGYLPYNDKSAPEDIYAYFGMSKKTFKMTTGALYKQRKIDFAKEGIKLVAED
jgi:predicted RNA-binding protein (virulence factor B family)